MHLLMRVEALSRCIFHHWASSLSSCCWMDSSEMRLAALFAIPSVVRSISGDDDAALSTLVRLLFLAPDALFVLDFDITVFVLENENGSSELLLV